MLRDDGERTLLFDLDTAIQRLTLDLPDHPAAVQLTVGLSQPASPLGRRLERASRRICAVRRRSESSVTATASRKSLSHARVRRRAALACAPACLRRRSFPRSRSLAERCARRCSADRAAAWLLWLLPVLFVASAIAWRYERQPRDRRHVSRSASGLCSVVLTRACSIARCIRRCVQLLDREVGGFDIATLGPEGDHDPILARAVLIEDASPRDGLRLAARGGHGTSTRRALATRRGRRRRERLAARRRATACSNGAARRTIEAPMVFRRPARFLNDGVPDFEARSARDGTRCSARSRARSLVDVIARGGPIDELAADVRAHVRTALARGSRHTVRCRQRLRPPC